ncbi:efflux RND transporter periplasmic adaptor subunit [soil metagenome]
MNKKLKWILITLVLLIVLLVVLKSSGVIGKKQGIKVSTEKITRRTITEIVNASGKVYPEVEVKVSPDISGEIVELNVREGDSIKKGQVLARIYADIYATQRDQAAAVVNQQQAAVENVSANIGAVKAQLDQARTTYKMQKQLYDEKVISLSEFTIADAGLKSAQANYNAALQSIRGSRAGVQSARAGLSKANKDISRATVTAPMDGVVSLLNVKKGERVVGNSMMAGTEMMRIADLSKIEVRVDVGENDIPKVHIGDTAIVGVEAYTNRKFKGIVTQIAGSNTGAASQNAASAAGITDVTNYKVYIRLLKESYADLIDSAKPKSFPFRPGMSASADIQTTTHINRLAVPINAVTTRDKNDTSKSIIATGDRISNVDDLEEIVFIIRNGQVARKVKVRTDIQDINYIEVLSGLNEGDEVITGPYETVSKTLKDSTLVKIVPKSELFEKKKE